MRILRIILIAYFVGLAVLALFVLAAKPGPAGQVTQGVRLGDWQSTPGTVYFSGKRLACEPAPAGAIYNERCRLDIAGQELVLLVGDRPLTYTARGTCQATYCGQEHPCTLQTHHNWPASSVAYIGSGLDLSAAQRDEVRQRFPIENLPEQTIVRDALILWLLTALALFGALIAFLPLRRLSRMVTIPAFIVIGLVALLGVPFGLILLTRSFWD